MNIFSNIAAAFFELPGLDEILLNGSDSTFWVSAGGVESGPRYFSSDGVMQQLIQDLAFSQGQRLDPFSPACGGLLEIGDLQLRWHSLLPPLSRDGPLLSLRRQRLLDLELEHFVALELAEKLAKLWQQPRATFIIGPTGSGKTSLLISLLKRFAFQERVAILEQVPEIPRISARWIRLAAQNEDLQGRGKFPLEHVFDELLRLRPDSVAIGELRHAEARALRRALLAGVGSIWCTLHAKDAETICDRLQELSHDSAESWEEHLHRNEAVILITQRTKPRLREAWLYGAEGLEIIFCEAKGIAKQVSS